MINVKELIETHPHLFSFDKTDTKGKFWYSKKQRFLPQKYAYQINRSCFCKLDSGEIREYTEYKEINTENLSLSTNFDDAEYLGIGIIYAFSHLIFEEKK